jgi:glycosyltransferase involved in cell wall biosynthesis
LESLPLRILQVVPTYLPATRYGGPIYSVHGLARGLVELGHEVHVFTTNVDGAGESDVPLYRPVDIDGVNVWYFPATWPRRSYRSPALGKALIKMVPRFAIVHLHSVFLWPTWAAAVACRKAGVPYLLSPRGMMVKELVRLKSRFAKTAWIKLIERSNLEHASAIHVTADIEAREIESFGFALPPLVSIPNGVDPPPLAAAQGTSPEVRTLSAQRPLILYLGRINWKKNLIELVRSMRDIPQGHLGIVGYEEDGHGTAVASLAASLGLADRVTVLARPILGTDKEALLAACDLFVLPSLSENFGNAALEASIRGKPIVVSEGAGVATLIEEHHCGLICQPNAKALAHSITLLLRDPDSAKSMGERGRTAAISCYSWSAVARRMSAAYESAIRGRPSRATRGDGAASIPATSQRPTN